MSTLPVIVLDSLCMFGLGCLCRRSRATMARSYRWAAWRHHESGYSPCALHVQLGERERGRAVVRKKSTRLGRPCPQQERIFLQTERENEIFKQDVPVNACTTRRGTRSARATCSRTVTGKSTGDRDSECGEIATWTTFLLTALLFFTLLTSNFPTLFVFLNFILWSGSFLKIPSGKRKISEKPPKTP